MEKDIQAVAASPTEKKPSGVNSGRERVLTQYGKRGNAYQPTTSTVERLAPGVYNVATDMMGSAVYDRTEITSDSLLRLNNGKLAELRAEMKSFWENREKFKNLGFTHKRGFLFYGEPGTGKSCYLKLAMEDMVEDDSVVFITKSANSLTEVLKQFKEVEPERKVMVVLEDMDELISWGEHALLELMDGPNSVDGVFYIGTTNYLNRIPPRMLRKSRFDRKIEIGPPDEADRLEYFKSKLGTNEGDDNIIKLAKSSAGMVFSDLKDLLVAIYCLGIPMEKALTEMRSGGLSTWGKSCVESDFTSRFNEDFQTPTEREALHESTDGVKPLTPQYAEKSLAEQILADMDSLKEEGEAPAAPIPVANIDANGVPNSDFIKAAFEAQLARLNLEDVLVDSVQCDTEGNTFIDFASGDDLITVVFTHDEDEGACALIDDPESTDDDDDYTLVIDLDHLGASTMKTNFGTYVNLGELSWLTRNIMLTILDAGDYDLAESPKEAKKYDAFGQILNPSASAEEAFRLEPYLNQIDEVAYKVVVRGGKKERLPIVRRRRKRRLTPKQRAGIRKAIRTRKSSASKMKRKRSLAVRKRLHLPQRKLPRGYRVGG